MSLSIKLRKQRAASPRYFLYLKAGQIAKSIFTKHPVLSGVALLAAYLILKNAGVTLSDLKKFGGKLIQIHRRINAMVVEFASHLTAEQIAWLEENLRVTVEPVREVQAYMNVAVIQSGVAAIHEKTDYRGNGITVAVVDTGINDKHPDLQGKVVGRKNFTEREAIVWPWSWFTSGAELPKDTRLDGVGHGTHCAGVIAGNGLTYRGVAPNVVLLDARVLGNTGHGTNDTVIKGMSWAADNGADIISMSLGGNGTPDDAISREANALAEEGIVVVVAAGNEGPRPSTIGSPGCAEKVITVGAVDQQNRLTNYSSRGPIGGVGYKKPDLVAPGGGTSSVTSHCYYENGITSVKSLDTVKDKCTVVAGETLYQRMSGTSMAAPMVSGICALLLEASKLGRSVLNRCELVKQALKTTTKHLPGYSLDEQGAGLVDAAAAINKLEKKA